MLATALVVILAIAGVHAQRTTAVPYQPSEAARRHSHLTVPGYAAGEGFSMECKNTSGGWGPGPICKETNAPMEFHFGVDAFVFCGWEVRSDEMYDFLTNLASQRQTWHCRVPMTPSKIHYLPFSIPVWGMVEADHSHFNSHLNFVFHAGAGRIMGVAAYPVRDRFIFTKPGTLINMHGPVKWFHRHSFKGYAVAHHHESLSSGSEGTGMGVLLITSLMTALACAVVFAMLYQQILRPALVRKYLKVE